MSKRSKLISKGTGVFLVLWGIFSFVITLFAVITIYQFVSDRMGTPDAKISYTSLVYSHHHGFLLSIFFMCSGFFIILKKYWGWILGLSACIIQLLSLGLIFYDYHFSKEAEFRSSFNNENYLINLFVILFSVIFTVIGSWLLSKNTRDNFNVDKSKWIILFLIIGLLIIDRIII